MKREYRYVDKKYIYLQLANLGALRAPVSARTPNRWSRINPNFEQTQTSNKPKVRTNPNFEQIQISNKPKVRTNPKVSGLGGFRIIRP